MTDNRPQYLQNSSIFSVIFMVVISVATVTFQRLKRKVHPNTALLTIFVRPFSRETNKRAVHTTA